MNELPREKKEKQTLSETCRNTSVYRLSGRELALGNSNRIIGEKKKSVQLSFGKPRKKE